MARADARTELLMSTPAVGPIVALTTIAREDGRERPYACAIDDPARFKSSKQAGAHFGLTPKKYQSGETDYTGRISKIGAAEVREALYQAAHVMLTKPVKGCADLKSWAEKYVGVAAFYLKHRINVAPEFCGCPGVGAATNSIFVAFNVYPGSVSAAYATEVQSN